MAVEPWAIGATAALAGGVLYATLAVLVWRAMRRLHVDAPPDQSFARFTLTNNPISVAVALLMLATGVADGLFGWFALEPAILKGHFVSTPRLAAASRTVLGDWRTFLFEGLALAVALWFLVLHRRIAALVRGASVFEEMRRRREQALELHDNIVQGIAEAKLALQIGDEERAVRVADETLERTKGIITGLLATDDDEEVPAAGELRRQRSAGA